MRHARLSGCCENARNIHIPTRVGGPIGAFVLQAIHGGEQCHVCKAAPFSHPELFTVWPKSHHHAKSSLNVSQESGSSRLGPKRRIVKVNSVPPTPVNGNNYTSESYSMDDSVTAQDQEQPSSEALLPGSVSIDESYSIASPIRTPTQSVSISSLVAQDSLL